MGRAWFRCGEIRILDSTGAVERIIPFSDSAICITILFLPSWRDFWQNVWKPRSESGRGRFSRQLFPMVQTCSRTINQSGEQKGCLMKTKTSPVTNPMNSAPCRLAFLLLPLVLTLACFAFSPLARAVCQEGCLTNNNTVLGDDALLNNTGSFNTAIGANAQISNTTGG